MKVFFVFKFAMHSFQLDSESHIDIEDSNIFCNIGYHIDL